ncbi:MAG: alanine racemase [Rhodospirillales bacterium]
MPGTAGLLIVDLDAIAANWRLLAQRAASARCAAVVKADGYGLGAIEVSRRLRAEGCDWFFTAHLEEAIALKPAVPDATVVALNGLLAGNESATIEHEILPTLNDLGQIALWQSKARQLNRRLPAIIHIDTGMNRLGLQSDAVDRLANEPGLLDGIDIVLWMSHFACADLKDHKLTAEQQTRFAQALKRLPKAPASLANSSGIFLGPQAHYDLVRPGAALYGINPTPWVENPLQPVVTLTGKIVQIHKVDTNGTVGYGAEWRAQRPSRIATVAVGYADGYLRSAQNRTFVALDGTRLPVIGRISMDLITIDVTDAPSDRNGSAIAPGSEVELLGSSISADELGEQAGTIGYEILTQLGKRYHRRYQGAVA